MGPLILWYQKVARGTAMGRSRWFGQLAVEREGGFIECPTGLVEEVPVIGDFSELVVKPVRYSVRFRWTKARGLLR